MIHFDLPKEKSSIIKVIGIGGGGSNAVNHMYSQRIEGVNFIICNTDAQAIANSPVPNKIQLGPHLTQGLGAGANPEIGKQATEESFEEIKKILEVNTKMAFITAGMGGGTGTGGAPIIARICKELGILTVGIVTTPFSYEGKKRMLQADEGVTRLKEYVDTLLIISNDKLRQKFGDLKFKAAFEKADNVLATAAKCITDVINSTGQINVDFADVCTVMRNGGVAILGASLAEGENRAQRAIEDALTSPLLNDNDIRGAKWILINISSSEGEFEHTLDEMDIIQAYVQSQAGEDCDVILGVGYDQSLDRQLGVTIIATGFEQKPITQQKLTPSNPERVEPKIVMQLGKDGDEKKMNTQQAQGVLFQEPQDLMAPRLMEPVIVHPEPVTSYTPPQQVTPQAPIAPARQNYVLNVQQVPVQPQQIDQQQQQLMQQMQQQQLQQQQMQQQQQQLQQQQQPIQQIPPAHMQMPGNTQQNVNIIQPQTGNAAGGYLNRPSHIYVEPGNAVPPEMKMVYREEDDNNINNAPAPPEVPMQQSYEDLEEQKRKQAERVAKLRSISFNVKNMDNNAELENVPAYLRRNVNLDNGAGSAEHFYSNYTVSDPGQNNHTEINTINTFLDGKKPD
ncbi:cell division protein FtsZ [Chitinophaga nivalis]|uniref:Cell division protein FtsZ n=2 Tax=Chitinophaga TaxID=79328 RepID=A0ABT3ISR9_9BACT|nr:cell division protein FtsZ [Chitinophaga nivalis]MCW3463278.1 cell division protein FtsZ [Chitinophaga nivalis]MCW3487032.1 cell division protein FtsZ [Chitinophaga nivalis]